MAQAVHPTPLDLSADELRETLRIRLQMLLTRRGAVHHGHAVLRDLRLEMKEVLTRAPVTGTNFLETVEFRARLGTALDEVISEEEAAITADFGHLPGVRN